MRINLKYVNSYKELVIRIKELSINNAFIIGKDASGKWVTPIINRYSKEEYSCILGVDAVLLFKDNLDNFNEKIKNRYKIGKYYAELNYLIMYVKESEILKDIQYPIKNVYIYTEKCSELYNHYITIGKSVKVRPYKKDGEWYYLEHFGYLFLSKKYYKMLLNYQYDIKRVKIPPKKYSYVTLRSEILIGKLDTIKYNQYLKSLRRKG